MNAHRDYNWLRRQYVFEEKSIKDIAFESMCCPDTISKWLDIHRIPKRNRRDMALLSLKHREPPSGSRINTWNGGVDQQYAVKCWEQQTGHKKPPGLDLHHIDGDKRNNHINNLALISPSGHQRLHRMLDLARGKGLFGKAGVEVENA